MCQRPVGAVITLVVDEAEELAAVVSNAVSVGAVPYVEATKKPWGQTVAYVRDPNGILIELATKMAG